MARQIEVNVKGGLGNQIFGLAAGWAVAAELNSNLLINGRDLGWRGSNRSRKLELNQLKWQSFPNELNFIRTRRTPSFGRVGNRITTYVMQSALNARSSFDTNDNPENFIEIANSAKEGKILDGNYINFKWLDLAHTYGFPTKFNLLAADIPYVPQKEEVAVHIRLGDFLHYPNLFPIPSLAYYEHALVILKAKRYAIYSDDISVAKDLYPKLLENAHKIVSPSQYTGTETFVMLNSYSSIVTSSSTFSSIAAWGIGKQGGKVVCPEFMLFDDKEDSRPSNWIKVSN